MGIGLRALEVFGVSRTDHPAIETLSLLAKAPTVEDIAEAVQSIARVRNRGSNPEAAVKRLGELLRALRIYADLLGRATVTKTIPAAIPRGYGQKVFAHYATELDDVPRVVSTSTLDDLLSREPVPATSAEEVMRVYTETHGFALAWSADKEITAKVQEALATSLRGGRGREKTADVVASMGDWSLSYARLVYDMNISTSYSAGQHREADRVTEMGILAAFMYQTSGTPTEYDGGRYVGGVRPWHKQADGLIAQADDPIWDRITPPIDYGCLCLLRVVDEVEIPKRLFISPTRLKRAEFPQGFAPRAGFGHRPDKRIYGGLV